MESQTQFAELESFEEWCQFFIDLVGQEQDNLWIWADGCLAYKRHFRSGFRSLCSSIPRSIRTCDSYSYTAEIFPPPRYFDVPFSIYRLAAYSLEPQYWLEEAAKNAWSAAQLREAIAADEGKSGGMCMHRKIYCELQKKIVSRQECTRRCLLRADDHVEQKENQYEEKRRRHDNIAEQRAIKAGRHLAEAPAKLLEPTPAK